MAVSTSQEIAVSDDSSGARGAIRLAIHKNRKDFETYLNVHELSGFLLEEEGLLGEKVIQKLQVGRYTPKSLLSYLLRNSRDPDTLSKFVHCLKREQDHAGHRYLVSLIETDSVDTEVFHDAARISESRKIQQRVRRNMTRMSTDLNLEELHGILVKEGLLTQSEFEVLSHATSRKERNQKFFAMLDKKSPIAYLVFASCLEQQDSDHVHSELLDLITSSTNEHERSLKRKPTDLTPPPEVEKFALCTKRTKRSPYKLEMQGDLVTKYYRNQMKKCREALSCGRWKEIGEMANKEARFSVKIAIVLEDSMGCLFQGMSQKAIEIIEQCEKDCEQVEESENRSYLLGRCAYTKSWACRYAGDHVTAERYSRDATHHLFSVELGEDASLANYNRGCLLALCCNSESGSADAERCFILAIESAEVHDCGLEHLVPHSHNKLTCSNVPKARSGRKSCRLPKSH